MAARGHLAPRLPPPAAHFSARRFRPPPEDEPPAQRRRQQPTVLDRWVMSWGGRITLSSIPLLIDTLDFRPEDAAVEPVEAMDY